MKHVIYFSSDFFPFILELKVKESKIYNQKINEAEMYQKKRHGGICGKKYSAMIYSIIIIDEIMVIEDT